MIIHEYYTFAPNREALERHFFIRNGNTKAVILVGSARARYFALWHVVRSQATGTGVPLRIFQMSPADDRLWNEGRGICSWLGPWKLCLWKNTEFMWWFSLMYAIRNHSCIFILLTEWANFGDDWIDEELMYLNGTDEFLCIVSWRDQVELIRNMKGWTHVMNTGIMDSGSIIWDERSVATIQWVMSNPWMIPRVNDEYPQVSRHWHLWTETGYICWKAVELPRFPIRTRLVQLPDKFPCYVILLDQISLPKSTKPAQSRRAGCCLKKKRARFTQPTFMDMVCTVYIQRYI